MNYSDDFKKMLAKAEKEHLLYVGTGNPNARILIIGKELAFDKEANPEQAKGEIEDNIPNWKKNVENNISQEEVRDCYNPLYLYKGKTIEKEGHTWSKYQKLMDLIRNAEAKHPKTIDFQEFSFITEYNIHPSKRTQQQEKTSRKESIKRRDEFFRTTEFFQQFPIVIVAAGDYAHCKFDVELEKTFGVEYTSLWEIGDSGLVKIEKGKEHTRKTNQWFSLHYSPTKLVVHTRQLSSNIKNELLQEMAKKVKDFMKEKDIQLG
ncbi:MAG: hypothetical protein NC410_06835 [Oscillibacter sp.]|nr:hypothetical protein [Oscillibacter sp.]